MHAARYSRQTGRCSRDPGRFTQTVRVTVGAQEVYVGPALELKGGRPSAGGETEGRRMLPGPT